VAVLLPARRTNKTHPWKKFIGFAQSQLIFLYAISFVPLS
jgi:hypothetical protein